MRPPSDAMLRCYHLSDGRLQQPCKKQALLGVTKLDRRFGLHRAYFSGPDVPRGYKSLFTVLHDGVHLTGGGLPAFAAHMKRIKAFGIKDLEADDVMLLLHGGTPDRG